MARNAFKTLNITNGTSLRANRTTIVSDTSTTAASRAIVDAGVIVKDAQRVTMASKEDVTLAALVDSVRNGDVVSVSPGAKTLSPDDASSVKLPQKSRSAGMFADSAKDSNKRDSAARGISKFMDDVGGSDKIDVSDQTFTVIEKTIGISQERPEIISMLGFLPIFCDSASSAQYVTSDPNAALAYGYESSADYGLTQAGKFFDAQYKMRLMKIATAHSTQRFARKRSRSKKPMMSEFQKAVDEVESILTTMLSIVRSGDRLKSTMGIRDIVCSVQSTAQKITQGDLRVPTNSSDKDLTRFDNVITPASMSPLVGKSTHTTSDMLNALGFDLDASNIVFSSTKLWLQLLYELRLTLKHSSDRLIDVQTYQQQVDVDPVVINKHSPSITRVGGRSIKVSPLGSWTQLPSYNDVIVLNGLKDDVSVLDFVQVLLDTHDTVYNGVGFSDTGAKIVALMNMLSQEYRYSYAFRQQIFRNILQRDYGYAYVTPNEAGDNNVKFIDAVLGTIPNKITDVVMGNPEKSLVSIAQQVIGDIAVLPLESKYVELEASTLTPGGVYYIDDSLKTFDGKKFNIEPLKSYYTVVTDALKHFIPISLITNMYMFDRVANSSNMSENEDPDRLFSDSRFLLAGVVALLTDRKTATDFTTPFDGLGKDGWEDDGVWGVFAYAAKNPRVLALLFLLVSSRSVPTLSWFGATSPSSQDYRMLIDMLLSEIENDFVVHTSADNVQTFNGLNDQKEKGPSTSVFTSSGVPSYGFSLQEDLMRSKLVSSGGVIDFVASVLTQLAMKVNPLFEDGSRTPYSGMPQTLMMFLLFESICLFADDVGHVHIDYVSNAASSNVSQRTFHVRVNEKKFESTLANLYTRLESERAKVQGLLTTVLAVLAEIGYGIKSYLTLLTPTQSETTFANSQYLGAGTYALSSITNVLGDVGLSNALLSEQQLMSALNNVLDVKEHVDRAKSIDDAYAIIDDALDDPKHTVLLDVIYSTMSDRQFQSTDGYNKKILTIGLPAGFATRFRQRVVKGAKNSTNGGTKEYTDKVCDLVNVVVRKIDVRYNELVYRPMSFLFDLSRYPARAASLIKSDKAISYSSVAMCVGTRDFGSSDSATGDVSVDYFVPDVNVMLFGGSNVADKVRNQGSVNSYPFLTSDQRASLYRNHVLSFLFEVYYRIMTGLNVADNAFTFKVDYANTSVVDNVRDLTDSVVSSVANNAGASSDTSSTIFSNLRSSSAAVPRSDKANGQAQPASSIVQSNGIKSDVLLEACKQVSAYANIFSNWSNDVYAKQRLLSPRQFDRVFNVMIDPDDFVIDVQETSKTLVGRQTLESLLRQGELVEIEQQTSSATTTSIYRGRSKTRGDIAFDKYIVNVESFDDDGV